MYYAPHKVYRKLQTTERDEYGRIVSQTEEWQYVGVCRCDKNSETEFRNDVGVLFRPSFHVVLDKTTVFKAGDIARVLDAEGNEIAKGEVTQCKSANYYNYTEIYI